jgi:LacI family transcriptional regulator
MRGSGILKATGRVTQRDVARAAGVSLMTVSMVLNSKDQAITQETRGRVKNAIEALGYRPHFNARSLRLAKRFSICMLVVDSSPTFLADAFTTYLVAGLCNYLSANGYSLTLQGIHQDRIADALAIRNIGADGLCVFLSGPAQERQNYLELLRGIGEPTVLFQETLDPGAGDFCCIRQDDAGGADVLARHVLSKGARKLIMLVAGREWPAISERERGMRRALAATEPRASLEVVSCGAEDFDATQSALARYVDKFGLPDAIFGTNDQMAIAAVKWLASRNVKVPDQVRVAGFNAFEFRRYSALEITSIRSPAYEMGQRGGEEMIRRLSRDAFSALEILLPTRFEPGEST